MSTYSSANQFFHEIVSVGSPHPRVDRWLSANADVSAEAVEYWSRGELCPEIACKLVTALSATINQRFHTNINSLIVRIRMSPSRFPTGYFDTSATLLHCPPEDSPEDVETMRGMAASLLAGLQRPSKDHQIATDEGVLKHTEALTDPLELMTMPVAAFMGARLSEDLIAHIPGRRRLEFKCKFRDAPQQPLTAETFDVLGLLSSVKSRGRSRSADVVGFRQDTHKEFKQSRVLYGEELRESIARSVSEPWRKLLMSVTRTAVHCGRAKPLVTHTLQCLRFVD